MISNIHTLRACCEWANDQHERWWIPDGKPPPTALDILNIHAIVRSMDCDTIESALDQPEDSSLEGTRNFMRKRRLRKLLGLK